VAEVVRQSVEETLNGLLEAEADAICGANRFDYLTELDRHASEAASNPAAWMPWNYRETLAGLANPPGTTS
jgi:hypothetical protein